MSTSTSFKPYTYVPLVNVPDPTPIGACAVTSDEAELERIERWMTWKSSQILLKRVQVQLEKATKRGSKATGVPLADLHALMSLASVEKP